MRVLTATLFLLASISAAEAKLQICNDYKHPVRVALAYEGNGGFVTDGWFTVSTNECRMDERHSDLTSFYYYGETDVFDGQRTSWGRGPKFSVKDGDFELKNAAKKAKGARLVEFTGPKSFKKPETTVQLRFEADLTVTFVVPNENAPPPEKNALADAREACEKKSGDVAIQGCSDLIAADPKDAAAYLNRGIEYQNKGDQEKTIADYTMAIEINPKYAKAYNNRGVAYFDEDDYSHAIADYTRAIDFDPDYAFAYNNRGNAFRHIGAYDLALEDLGKAIELNQKYVQAYVNRGRTYEAMGKKDEAIADFRSALAEDPKNKSATEGLGRLGSKP